MKGGLCLLLALVRFSDTCVVWARGCGARYRKTCVLMLDVMSKSSLAPVALSMMLEIGRDRKANESGMDRRGEG